MKSLLVAYKSSLGPVRRWVYDPKQSSKSHPKVKLQDKMINWKLAIHSGLAMIAFAPLGAWLNISLPTKAIILILALFTAISVIPLIGNWHLKYEPSHQGGIKVGVFGGSSLVFLLV